MRLTKREAALATLAGAPLEQHVVVPEKREIKNHPEDDLQKACVEWLDIRAKRGDIRFTAINPRPGKKTFWQQKHDKDMGLRRGACDLLILKDDAYDAFNKPRTILCELKSKTGQLDDEQKDWANWLIAAGFEWHLVRDINELKEIVG